MAPVLSDHQAEIAELCREFQVRHLDAFGSVLTDAFAPLSDVDLLVTFDSPSESNAFDQYFGFKEALESLLGRQVDLVCYDAIRNSLFKQEIDAQRVPLYAA